VQKTGIEWCDYTSNPVRGYCPMACPYCYSRKIYDRFGWDKIIRFVPEELETWQKAKAGSRIFVGSMIELFHDKTIQYMPEIMNAISTYPHLRILLLTKQPQNLPKFSPYPSNCFVGVTVTGFQAYANAHFYLWQLVNARVKFLSIEPFLSWGIGVSPQPYPNLSDHLKACCNWLIIGACTGSWRDIVAMSAKYPALVTMPYGKKWTLQPKIEWIEEIVRACDKAGVKVFLKNNLKPLLGDDPYWANVVNSRQEMPVE